jgi:phosphohistidine phosphatase
MELPIRNYTGSSSCLRPSIPKVMSKVPQEFADSEHGTLDFLYGKIDVASMRRLMLLRHAKSDRSLPGMRDRDRPLAPRGEVAAARIGTYMAHHSLLPDRTICSTAIRTRATWTLVSKQFERSPPTSFEDRIYEAAPAAILEALRETPHDVHALLVIGHNPGMQDVAGQLIASGDVEARERLREKFPTTGLAVIDFAFDDWSKLHRRAGRLDRFVTPRSLSETTD